MSQEDIFSSYPKSFAFVTSGLVFKGPLNDFEALNKYVEEKLPQTKVIYRKVGFRKLYILEEKNGDSDSAKK